MVAAALAVLTVLTLPALVSCRRRAAPPSVVLVSFDALRADRLNTYGYTRRRLSPAIDRFARDGVLFEHAVAPSPWTTPSHLSLLTSLTPLNHGVTTPYFALKSQVEQRQIESLPEEVVTLAEVLRSAGYSTAAFTGGTTLDPRIGFSQGFDVYETSMFKVSEPAMKDMLAWMDRQQQRPFLLFWHTFETHDPYHVTQFLREVVSEETASEVERLLAEYIDRLFRGESPTELRSKLDEIGAARPEIARALYDGGVLTADIRFKQLLDHLKKIGRYDDATIVLTSDHGEELGERGTRGIFGRHGHILYDECLSVPLIIKLPKQAHAGARVPKVVSLIDVMPTVLSVLGLDAGLRGIEGRPLRALWEGTESEERRAISEALAFGDEKKSVRTGPWKYILSVSAEDVARHGRAYLPTEGIRAELYDVQADPRETDNLVGRQGPPQEIARTLDAVLRRHVATARGLPARAALPPGVVERLEALGYVR